MMSEKQDKAVNFQLQQKIKDVKEIRDIQGSQGNYDQGDYMMGLYNGLEMSLALMEGRNPEFKDTKDKVAEKREARHNLEYFRDKLIKLINYCSLENKGNIPDYIIANYLVNSYKNLSMTINDRDTWFRLDPWDKKDYIVKKHEKLEKDFLDLNMVTSDLENQVSFYLDKLQEIRNIGEKYKKDLPEIINKSLQEVLNRDEVLIKKRYEKPTIEKQDKFDSYFGVVSDCINHNSMMQNMIQAEEHRESAEYNPDEEWSKKLEEEEEQQKEK
jgi:CRISPR/Cas system CMR-associated protein Cmr5 small subunit